ncbi:MAG: ABC transporter permease [Bacteroidales bacterium]
MKLLLVENIRIALQSVRSHLMRTVLTVLIIAFGIMALVGILTAIDSLEQSLSDNFSLMGANTFSIRNHSMQVNIGHDRPRREYYRNITFREAMAFKQAYDYPAQTSVSAYGVYSATAKYKRKETDPNVSVRGSDENYLATQGYEIDQGRNFSRQEIRQGAHVALIGRDIKNRLFGNQAAVGKHFLVNNNSFLIIGVLKTKGSGFGFSGDRNVIIPIKAVRNVFGRPDMNYEIDVKVTTAQKMQLAIDEAIGTFRVVRGLKPEDVSNFDIGKSDSLVKAFKENMSYITIASTLIGFITLMGAAVGLMNIMIVSVTERTREIGIRKAMGASAVMIRNQFLVEAITISQIGGLLGILFGVILGNITAILFKTPFVIPWLWVFAGVALCIFVGLLSGLYPAMKAARFEPIESLRYE